MVQEFGICNITDTLLVTSGRRNVRIKSVTKLIKGDDKRVGLTYRLTVWRQKVNTWQALHARSTRNANEQRNIQTTAIEDKKMSTLR